MQKNYQPKRLDLLALGEWVKMVGRGLMEPFNSATQRDPNSGHLFLQLTLDCIRQTLYDIYPLCFIKQRGVNQVLTSVDQLINETKSEYSNYSSMARFINKMKVAVHLAEIVMHPQLKSVVVYNWPKNWRHLLNFNLDKLVGLETLDIGFEYCHMNSTEIEYILSSVRFMTKLTTFRFSNCTDTIISFLGRSCPHLQELNVTYSTKVTDSSIPFILNCQKLLTVYVHGTSVSPDGYMELLTEHPSIQDIGLCDKIDKILQMLHEKNSNPLAIKSLKFSDELTEEQLRLLDKYFPKLYIMS